MTMRKYQSVEKTEVVSPEGHDKIAADLKKVGKTSAAELTDAERATVRPLDKQ
jgi:hypothetical protein